MISKFRSGDYIFYKDKDGATHSTKIWVVTKKRLLVENWQLGVDEFGNARPVAKYVSPENCQLQSEWEKEHNQNF